jgi:hypothetical protein
MKIHGITIKTDDIVGIELGEKPYVELQPRPEYSAVHGAYTDRENRWTRIRLTERAGHKLIKFLDNKRLS